MRGNCRLTPIGYPPNKTIRGIRFGMKDDLGGLVEVLVTHAALGQLSIPSTDGDLARFGKHRESFERLANAKFARGDLEDDGSIAILAGDCWRC